jgi:hypothetical protein
VLVPVRIFKIRKMDPEYHVPIIETDPLDLNN